MNCWHWSCNLPGSWVQRTSRGQVFVASCKPSVQGCVVIITIKVLIERSCHTKFYERSLQTPSSEQYCQSAKFHYCTFTRDVTKGAITRSRFKEGTFQVAEGKVRQIQKSLNKFELSRFLASAAWKLASWLRKIKCAKFKLM